ncbi:hypothetical protein [Nitrospina gracilis]|uniref:hypothetical protein n=1 Tax=Nitrospina gracilis TaxID=35801 RepID=UPI001F457270|nr:hypothetical protein [Nitrospina gracilis]MCF8721641.1 hypothetical protein [Nitrospina gracilis Nb-211]
MGYFSEIIRDSRPAHKPIGVRPQTMPMAEAPPPLAAGEGQDASVRPPASNAVDGTHALDAREIAVAPESSGDESIGSPAAEPEVSETIRDVSAGDVEFTVEPDTLQNPAAPVRHSPGYPHEQGPAPVFDPPFRSQEEAQSSSAPVFPGAIDEKPLQADASSVPTVPNEESSFARQGRPESIGEPAVPYRGEDGRNDNDASFPVSTPGSKAVSEVSEIVEGDKDPAPPYPYKEAPTGEVEAEGDHEPVPQQSKVKATRSVEEKPVREQKPHVPEAPAYNYEQPMHPAESLTSPPARTEPVRVPETNIHIGQIDIVVQAPQKPAKPQPPASSNNWTSRLYLRRV